ncbi:unnamed protein product [Nezara viridula]|uniref:Uncharacterized protein n=1 Tax=Nezara viridula TaxID=85310 RepID=A0A9P0HI95_NEZVI|nr:unnamed protein product [Nezara viridula]
MKRYGKALFVYLNSARSLINPSSIYKIKCVESGDGGSGVWTMYALRKWQPLFGRKSFIPRRQLFAAPTPITNARANIHGTFNRSDRVQSAYISRNIVKTMADQI